jgi:hypothetical protein
MSLTQSAAASKPLALTKMAASESRSQTKRSGEIARQILLKFVALTGKKASDTLFDIWDRALGDIPSHRLELAGERLLATWRFPNLPMPGDVRALLDGADENAFDLEAEKEWEKLLAWISENYFPDMGIRRGAPHLSSAVEHAARAAGRYRFLEACSPKELGFARKTFLAAYKNVHETRKVEDLFGEREAKKILAGLTRERKQLRQGAPALSVCSSPPSRDEVRQVLTEIVEQRSAPELTDDELAANWERQKRALLARV